MTRPPFFTIGVTTYDRPEMLRQALASLVKQTFTDFEVIVGNDCQAQHVSANTVGIRDERFDFVNYPANLGERGNMNALLSRAKGRYFSWLADDDLYRPDALFAVHSALSAASFPAAAFVAYDVVDEASELPRASARAQPLVMSGAEFLRRYLAGELRAIGTSSFYETEYLRNVGGAVRMADTPFALFSEYQLIARAGFLDRVAYVAAPVLLFRDHAGSWGRSNLDAHVYPAASERLVREFLDVLTSPALRPSLRRTLSPALSLPLSTYISKLSTGGRFVDPRRVLEFLRRLVQPLRELETTADRATARAAVWRVAVGAVPRIALQNLQALAPSPVISLARATRTRWRRVAT